MPAVARLPPVIVPVADTVVPAATSPAVVTLPPVMLPVADTLLVLTLPLSRLPVAVIRHAVSMLPPVTLPDTDKVVRVPTDVIFA